MTIAAMYGGDDVVPWRQATATIKALQYLAGVRQRNEDVLWSIIEPTPDPVPPISDHSPGQEIGAPLYPMVPPARLTPRELEVLRIIATGARNREIAEQLSLSVRTVRFHTENLYQKLRVQNRTQAVRVATDRGLLQE